MNLLLKTSLQSAAEAKLSKSYIDEYGNLHLHESVSEKRIKYAAKAIKEIPPIGIFLILSLIAVQLYIVFGGMYYHSVGQYPANLKVYAFISIFILGIIGSLLKLAWLFAVEEESAQKHKERYTNDNSFLF